MARRFDKYPQMSALVRAMGDEGREMVRHWHTVLLTALEGYKRHAGVEARQVAATPTERLVAVMAADAAVNGWLNIMREVAEIIVDPSAADWCCARGMQFDPAPCPQHGFDLRVLYDEGTIIERTFEEGLGTGTEKAVHVNSPTADLWVSITFGTEYRQAEMNGVWRVIGRA